MILIYASTATTFTDNGLGGLNPTSCIVKETLNGDYSLSMKHPIDAAGKWQKIAKQRIIKVTTHDGSQLFRIYSVEKNIITKSVDVEARHIFYDLLNNLIESAVIADKTGTEAGAAILAGCQFASGFTFSTDITDAQSVTLTRVNPVQAFIGDDPLSFVNKWGGEIRRNNKAITINSRRGADNGAKVTYRKNMVGMTVTEDTETIITRLFPICIGAGNTIIILPEKVIDSARLADYPTALVGLYRIDDIPVGSDDFPTDTEVFAEMRLRCAAKFAEGIDIPKMSFDVDIVDLSKTEQYSTVAPILSLNLGDDVTVTHAEYGVSLKLRVVMVKWDVLLQKYQAIEIGDKLKALDDYLATVGKDVETLKNALSMKWFDERSKNIIPCYNSQVAAPDDAYNVAIIQTGKILRGTGTGKRNIAIGPFSETSGDEAIAIGDTAKATGSGSIAMGDAAISTGAGVAIGDDASSTSGVAVGDGAAVTNGVAIGSGSTAGDDAVAIAGVAEDDGDIVIGHNATTDTTGLSAGTIVIGLNATITDKLGAASVIIGKDATATKGGHVVIGSDATTQGITNISIGRQASGGLTEDDIGNIAIGASADVGTGNSNTGIGYGATIGELAANKNVAIGSRARVASGDSNIIIGSDADDSPDGGYVAGDKNIIIGNGVVGETADVDNAIKIGFSGPHEATSHPIIDGDQTKGINFQSQDIAETPLRSKLLTGQTANAYSVLDPSDAVLGGFEANGGAVSIVDRNTGDPVKLWIGEEPPETIAADTQYLSPIKLSNEVMNGKFDTWQRGESLVLTPATIQFLADRWTDYAVTDYGALPALTRSKQTLTDYRNQCSRIAFDGAGTMIGSYSHTYSHKILNGTRRFGGKLVTVQFWARSDVSGKKIAVCLVQDYGESGSSTEVVNGETITLTSAWVQYSVTFQLNTLTAKTIGADDYIQIQIAYAWGTDYLTRYGTDAAHGYVGAGYVDLADVGLHVGGGVFDLIDSADDCRRYFQIVPFVASAHSTAILPIYQAYPIATRIEPYVTPAPNYDGTGDEYYIKAVGGANIDIGAADFTEWTKTGSGYIELAATFTAGALYSGSFLLDAEVY